MAVNYPASRLPQVGTTIFTVMSKMAEEYKAINLSQGFPDFNGPKALLDRVAHYIRQGANQYAPMTGTPALRQAVAEKVADHYGRVVSAEDEVTITSGATEALFNAISSVVSAGDEVIVFDPAFDSYVPVIELNRGVPVHIQLQPPGFQIDWQAVRHAVTDKTRLIIFNSPHNPSGTVLSPEDLQELSQLVQGTDILLIADDVYEHIIFDGLEHQSFISPDVLYERTFTVSSFGKTYHATGWKIGYCVAPPALTREFRKVHQFVTFTTHTPTQLALADYMQQHPEHCYQLGAFYQQKRDVFCEAMKPSRFQFTPSQGTYFQVMDYSAVSDLQDVEFCNWLTQEIGVAAIPISVFCKDWPQDQRLVRFCFAKNEQTLQQAAEKLIAL